MAAAGSPGCPGATWCARSSRISGSGARSKVLRMAGDGTVEWGGDRPVRLLDRLFGDAGRGGSRLSAPAVGAAVVATALFAAAELLPWMTVQAIVISNLQPGSVLESRDLPLDRVGT